MIARLFYFAFAVISCNNALAEFHVGETLNHLLSICAEKSDAIEIVNADADKGYPAANAVWEAKESCLTLPIQGGPVVGRVVHRREVERAGKKLVAKVVEILVGDKVAAYFITTQDVYGPRSV